MIDVIKSIILDFQEAELNTGVPRRLQIQVIPDKVTVCIGCRRSGKSTYMFQIIKRLLENDVPRENILFINFFDDRLHSLRDADLSLVIDAYFSLFPEKKNAEKIYCFFDEIQAVKGWESFVDRLVRTEYCEIYITGSSAQLLSREIATQMRGRSLSWEMFPFSFREYLDYKGIKSSDSHSTKKQMIIQKAFGEYWEVGGFPEVVGLPKDLRIKVHQEYFQSVLFRDLIERHDVSHSRALTDLAHRLMESIASLYSINSLTGYLKSLGHKASKETVSDFLRWFEDAFFLYTVRIYDASISRRNANSKKIYCADHAMVTSVSSGILVNSGHLLENLVFTALRRVTPKIFYYKSNKGREVDFLALMPDGSKKLFQVCEVMADPLTRKREIAALCEAMCELSLSEGTIVTRNMNEDIEVQGGTISVLPAWRFLLNLSKARGTGKFSASKKPPVPED